MFNSSQSIGSFTTELSAQKAVEALRKDGLNVSQATIINSIPYIGVHVAGYYNMPDRVLAWWKRGTVWGGIWGLAISAFLFWVPGIGMLLILISMLISAVAVGVLSALAAVVYSLGVPRNSVLRYESGDQHGVFVVMFEGSARQIRRARHVLESQRSVAAVLNMPVPTTSTVSDAM